MDAANRRMRNACRTTWNRDDYDAAVSEYNRVNPLRMAVNAGNMARTKEAVDDIRRTVKRERDHGSVAADEVDTLAVHVQVLAEQGITEPLRRCLNVLVGALESMAELI